MNDRHTHNDDLHLQRTPELERIETMLDALGHAEREAMRPAQEARVLEAVSQVFAPPPISIAPHKRDRSERRVWLLRTAAAACVALVATLGVLILSPRPAAPTVSSQATDTAAAWSLASFEEDLDAYLALNELGDGTIDDAVADWELWARTIENEFDSDLLGSELGIMDYNDGAL